MNIDGNFLCFVVGKLIPRGHRRANQTLRWSSNETVKSGVPVQSLRVTVRGFSTSLAVPRRTFKVHVLGRPPRHCLGKIPFYSRAQHEDEPPKKQAHVPREFCENGNAVSLQRASTFEHLGDIEVMDTPTTSNAK